MIRNWKAAIASGILVVVTGGWKVAQFLFDAASAPENTSKLWKALISAPQFIPWIAFGLCIAVLAWSVWPARRSPETGDGSFTLSEEERAALSARRPDGTIDRAKLNAERGRIRKEEWDRLDAQDSAKTALQMRKILGGGLGDILEEQEKDMKAEAEARRQRLIHGAAAEASERERRRVLISNARDWAHEFTVSTDGDSYGFREFLESQRLYADLRPHLSVKYLKTLEAVRTAYADADGAKYPSVVAWFLDDLARLEKKWKLI